ncbi:MAG: glycosyltransferase family 4 protein [Candidatus Hodarchaeales archaeon]
MNVNIYVGGQYTTLNSRHLPLSKELSKCGVNANLFSPINWNLIKMNKIKSIFSLLLTHFPNYYLKSLTDSPDVVIISRTSTPQIYIFQKILKRKGVKVVFDLDDPLFLPTSKIFGVNIRPGSYYLEKIIKNADFVTVNGHYLLNYVKSINKKCDIIHDPIDLELFFPKFENNDNKVTIGWMGSATSHYPNLVMLVKPLYKLANNYDIKFKIVSSLGDTRVKKIYKKLEKFIEMDYGLDHWVSLNEFAQLLSGFDITVAPLQKTSWYESKSAQRVGISMALGVPVVASPVGEQKYVIKHGVNGFLARNEEEWYLYLKTLIENDKLRKEIGKEGMATAERELSLKVNGRRLYQILHHLNNSSYKPSRY